ncbi:MAG: disulfide bond formation protein B [Roseobacter sp.]
MTSRQALILATLGSAGMMLAALAFQYLGGMPPCKMCYWQRYPHIAALLIGSAALVLRQRYLLLLGALAAAVTSAIGFFHAGVEQGWWEGPTTCTSGPVGGLSAEALLDQILTAPLVRCDEIPWSLFGLSMAGWNAVLSLCLTFCWLYAYRRS